MVEATQVEEIKLVDDAREISAEGAAGEDTQLTDSVREVEVVPIEAPLAQATKVEGAERRRIAMEKLSEGTHAFNLFTDHMVSEGTLGKDFLRPAFLENYMKVENKATQGMCSRCEWRYGCYSCDAYKALRYWVRKELLIDSAEEVRAKAKAKGRPKKS